MNGRDSSGIGIENDANWDGLAMVEYGDRESDRKRRRLKIDLRPQGEGY